MPYFNLRFIMNIKVLNQESVFTRQQSVTPVCYNPIQHNPEFYQPCRRRPWKTMLWEKGKTRGP